MTTEEAKVALVTGGSRGIGRAICERLAAEGYTVIVNYRASEDAALAVCDGIANRGGAAWPWAADVATQDGVRSLFDEIRRRHGRLDLLVNNAGATHEAPFALTPPERFLKMLQINFLSAVRVSQAALKLMVKQRSGIIVNVSSSSSARAPVGLGAYAASKAALDTMTMTLAKEVARYGIRVNGVAPSWTRTAMVDETHERVRNGIQRIPVGRIAEPEEVAAVVASLSRKDFSYVTGQIIAINGGGIL